MREPFMNLSQRIAIAFALVMTVVAPASIASEVLEAEVKAVYDSKLKELFLYFHRNPELSTMEHKTSARLADELETLGYTVHRKVGGTGSVALLETGEGPLVMFRADMDGLPVEEKSGLSYASRAKQTDPNGNEVFVMHACGHDVHITSLVGPAQLMSEKRDQWPGTLLLSGQPAEQRVLGVRPPRPSYLSSQ